MKRWWIAALAMLVLAIVLALVVPGIRKKSQASTVQRHESVKPDTSLIPEEHSMEKTSFPDPPEITLPSSGWRLQGSQVQWWIHDRLWKSVSLEFVTDDPSMCQLDSEKAQVTCGSDKWHLQVEADCISLLPSHNKDE